MIVVHKDTDLNASSIRIVHWDGQSLERTCLAKWLVYLAIRGYGDLWFRFARRGARMRAPDGAAEFLKLLFS